MKKKFVGIFAILAILFLSSVISASSEETDSIYIKIYEDGNAL